MLDPQELPELPDFASIVHLIAQEGNDLIGCELGIGLGDSYVTLLNQCRNIKTLIGIDFWQPYSDFLLSGDSNNPDYTNTQEQVEYHERIARNRVESSGESHRAEIRKIDSNDAVHDYENETFDFILVDTYMTREQAMNDLISWYPKLKKNGLFCGHDYHTQTIQEVVHEFRFQNNIDSPMSTFDRTFVWRKQ